MKRAGKCVNKKAYAYKSHALQIARKQYLEYGIKSSVYECPTCLDFHLTTKPQGKYNTEKYFNKWDKEWMRERYNEFLFLEKKMELLYSPSPQTLKNRAKRKRYKANKKLREAQPTQRQLNTLPLDEQRKILSELDKKRNPQPKSFWSRLLDIIYTR